LDSILEKNKEAYGKKSVLNFEHMYPESNVIRIHKKILLYKLGIAKGVLLDYGCANGIHTEYFAKNGYDSYGCDITNDSIKKAKELFPEMKDRFKVIDPKPNKDNFDRIYDIIFSHQVLYYLDDSNLKILIKQMYDHLNPGGIIIATMKGIQCYYYKNVVKTNREMSFVRLKGRLQEETWINFMHSEAHLLSYFDEFEHIVIGEYRESFLMEEGTSHHYIYVGKKPK
tara:strand:- start:1532 stop:2212 length:681 start_codon:yes stop_codon:yes gene_type:complete